MDLVKMTETMQNPAYIKWIVSHPFRSIEETSRIYDLVASEAFQLWQKTHPDGTIEEYINGVEYSKHQNFYSDDDEIEELEYEISQLKESNQELQSEIDYYKWKTSDLKESCNMLRTTSISFAIIIIILGFLLWRKWN